jgi:hypothetical protein
VRVDAVADGALPFASVMLPPSRSVGRLLTPPPLHSNLQHQSINTTAQTGCMYGPKKGFQAAVRIPVCVLMLWLTVRCHSHP